MKTLFLKHFRYIFLNKSTELKKEVSIKTPHYYYRVFTGPKTYLVISPEGYFTVYRIPKICALTMGIKKCIIKAPTIYAHIRCMPMYMDRSRWLYVGHFLFVLFYGIVKTKTSKTKTSKTKTSKTKTSKIKTSKTKTPFEIQKYNV